MERLIFQAEQSDQGKRIDLYLSELVDLTRSAIQRLCGEEYVRVDQKAVPKNYKVRGTEKIEIWVPPPKILEALPQNIPISVVFEDQHLLVVDKAKGMVVHPAAGNQDNTLVNALLHHCAGSLSGIGGVERPGIVHRIDKDTSGLLVIAKTDQAHLELSKQVKAHTFTRIYHTICYGRVKDQQGTINAPIGRHPTNRKKMCVDYQSGRDAVTHYQVINQYQGFAHLLMKLETGRTHQIRVHLHHIGHPVAGDPVYGPKKVLTSLNGQCLHAQTLGFVHPVTKEYLEFTSQLPAYFTSFLSKCKSVD